LRFPAPKKTQFVTALGITGEQVFLFDMYTPMAYTMETMQFIETSIFTRQVTSLLTDDEYSQLQVALFTHPEMGSIIPRSGGLRKVRWSMSGRGKRGGVRAIYYWVVKTRS
jgi:mRNA-degrading endonuclease RelE of RelBE toxin-antitoxin system